MRPGFAEPTALEYLIELTEILHFYAYSDPRPCFIGTSNPQNVIVDSFWKNAISSTLASPASSIPQKTSDTLVMGTPAYRSAGAVRLPADGSSKRHLFPGILLLYCITGEYKPEKCGSYGAQRAGPPDRHQSHDVRPRQTISDHGELLPDLLKARYPSVFSSQPIPIAVPPFRKHSRSRLPYFLLFLFTAGAGLAAGWRLSGKISLPETIFQKEDSYTFTEPLIEESVRSMLNKPEGLLTLSDLEKVTELHIFGLQIFSSDSEFSPSEVPSGFTM